MKKVIGLSIVLLIFVALNSCSTNGSANSNNSNGNGKLSKIVIQSSNGNVSLNFSYNSNGNFIRYYSSDASGSRIFEEWTYTRNSNEKIVGIYFKNTSQNYSEYTNYNLNSNGEYISSIKTPSNQFANRDSVVYHYNNGKISQTETYTSYNLGAWVLDYKERYNYDNNYNMLSIDRLNNSNQWNNYKTFTYDSNPSAVDWNDDVLEITNSLGIHNNTLTESTSSYNFTFSYTYGSNNRPNSASVLRTYTSSPTQTENWQYYYE